MVFISATVFAKVELPYIISDNMVLQQNTDIALWGKTKPKTKVVITTTWAKSNIAICDSTKIC